MHAAREKRPRECAGAGAEFYDGSVAWDDLLGYQPSQRLAGRCNGGDTPRVGNERAEEIEEIQKWSGSIGVEHGGVFLKLAHE